MHINYRFSLVFFLSHSFALSVSLDSVLQDVRSLEKGMEGTKKEFLVQDDIPALKEFVKANSDLLDSLVKDGKTAQVRPQRMLSAHKLSDKLILRN